MKYRFPPKGFGECRNEFFYPDFYSPFAANFVPHVQHQNQKPPGFSSLAVSVALVATKFYAYYLTHSQAVLTDALESIINVFTSGFALYSI